MPPVLDVALHELVGRGPEEVLAGDFPAGRRQGHHVLELVAKPVGAPGLIEGGAGPYPAGERLVEEPAVEHDVERAVRRLDLDGSRDVIPACGDRPQRDIQIHRAIAGEQGARVLDRRGLAEEEDHLAARRPAAIR